MLIDVPKYLVEHGVKPSYQRIKIMEYLMVKEGHPTVSDIYHALIDEIPTLSKTTVYNTLNLLMAHGLVNEVLIEENEVRYEHTQGLHGHFKCEVCQTLYDVPISLNISKISGLSQFKINEQHVFFKGVCANCKNSSEPHS